jgi:hypothetical protein
MNRNDAITLVLSETPGCSARKARRFASEMRVLCDQGYTFEAIRLALASSGVHVSNATVQREVASRILAFLRLVLLRWHP